MRGQRIKEQNIEEEQLSGGQAAFFAGLILFSLIAIYPKAKEQHLFEQWREDFEEIKRPEVLKSQKGKLRESVQKYYDDIRFELGVSIDGLHNEDFAKVMKEALSENDRDRADVSGYLNNEESRLDAVSRAISKLEHSSLSAISTGKTAFVPDIAKVSKYTPFAFKRERDGHLKAYAIMEMPSEASSVPMMEISPIQKQEATLELTAFGTGK